MSHFWKNLSGLLLAFWPLLAALLVYLLTFSREHYLTILSAGLLVNCIVILMHLRCYLREASELRQILLEYEHN